MINNNQSTLLLYCSEDVKSHRLEEINVALITNSPSGKPALVRCHAISRYHQATEMSDDIRALLHLYLCSLLQNKNQRPEIQRPTSEEPS